MTNKKRVNQRRDREEDKQKKNPKWKANEKDE